jgi:hypothetical protein
MIEHALARYVANAPPEKGNVGMKKHVDNHSGCDMVTP